MITDSNGITSLETESLQLLKMKYQRIVLQFPVYFSKRLIPDCDNWKTFKHADTEFRDVSV
jgi:hypothetical protein